MFPIYLSIALDLTSHCCMNRCAWQLTGVYQCLAHVFKALPRSALLPHVNAICAAIAESTVSSANNMLVRKLKVKLLQRVALTYLPPCETSWRYQMGMGFAQCVMSYL